MVTSNTTTMDRVNQVLAMFNRFLETDMTKEQLVQNLSYLHKGWDAQDKKKEMTDAK